MRNSTTVTTNLTVSHVVALQAKKVAIADCICRMIAAKYDKKVRKVLRDEDTLRTLVLTKKEARLQVRLDLYYCSSSWRWRCATHVTLCDQKHINALDASAIGGHSFF